MTDSLCRKRTLADSFMPCVEVVLTWPTMFMILEKISFLNMFSQQLSYRSLPHMKSNGTIQDLSVYPAMVP